MSLFGPVIDLISNVAGSYQARKKVAEENAAKIEEAKIKIKLAKLKTKAEQVRSEQANANNYDLQVLKNRNNSYMDEIMIIFVLVLVIIHFIPYFQPYLKTGWTSLKSAPIWFQFVVVGCFVSTLGLRSILFLYKRPSSAPNPNP